MKIVYFVRHGSTDHIETGFWQHSKSPLSKKGIAQASSVAKRFENIPVDVLISSNMTRALETANSIAEVTDKEVIQSDLFHEIVRPSAILGKRRDDPATAAIYNKVQGYFVSDSSERHSDEENFSDLKKRAAKAIAFLEDYPANQICVVTHGTFLKTMIAVMMEGNEVSPKRASIIYQFFYLSNTGITKCKFQDNKWVLHTWNDDAHLGGEEQNNYLTQI